MYLQYLQELRLFRWIQQQIYQFDFNKVLVYDMYSQVGLIIDKKRRVGGTWEIHPLLFLGGNAPLKSLLKIKNIVLEIAQIDFQQYFACSEYPQYCLFWYCSF
eukprot:TRINITY_DN1388_c0_g1_i5.p3 TRINITY_DN1388_c0_g1~~TRINITY_DN1388_c0_g1_i5.p3  ORF type:complete len:103 (-),score=5.67 TRINITY_DN1388_c0_g1_i5:214-522(-)